MIAMHLVLVKMLIEVLLVELEEGCNFHMTNDTCMLSYDIVLRRADWWFFAAPDIPNLFPLEYQIAPWVFEEDCFRTTQYVSCDRRARCRGGT